jgi:hypothetical protein
MPLFRIDPRPAVQEFSHWVVCGLDKRWNEDGLTVESCRLVWVLTWSYGSFRAWGLETSCTSCENPLIPLDSPLPRWPGFCKLVYTDMLWATNWKGAACYFKYITLRYVRDSEQVVFLSSY